MTRKDRTEGIYSRREVLDESERRQYCLIQLKDLLSYAYRYSEDVKKRFDRAQFNVEKFKTLSDIKHIPILKKKELIFLQSMGPRLGGLLTKDIGDLKRIFLSPGPIFDPEDRGEDYWGYTEAFYSVGFRPGDAVQNTFNYQLTPAGLMFEEPLRNLGILRGHQIMLGAGLGGFSGTLLVFFGLVSMFVAAIFIVGQGHYKRMLAYSSVEHMGILALAVGLGGAAAFGGMLHAVCHSLTKCMLFLLAGNILARYHTYSSYDVHGLRWTMPVIGALWMGGFLAIVGSPPFGLFVSEFLILKGILQQGQWLVAALYLLALAIIFVGMSVAVLRMFQGTRPTDMPECPRESALSVLPPMTLGLGVLLLGFWMPDGVEKLLRAGAALIGG